jgi:hypothetical protein
MTRLLVFLLIVTVSASAGAVELGSRQVAEKTDSHLHLNPGTPDGREGGEDMATAIPIPGLPFTDTGNTSDNINDYDPMCPYDGSTSPDVVYGYIPAQDEEVWVDLCGSGYDTNLAIFDENGLIVACNDDYYYDDPPCMNYVSFIEYALLSAGQQYYVIVDGYGGDSGDYLINMGFYDPCSLECVGVPEGEPPLMDSYEDVFNSGCGGPDPENNFTELVGDDAGLLTLCCKSGWYSSWDGMALRDTDWFRGVIGPTGAIEWTLDAERETYGFLLGPHNCNDVGAVEIMTAGPCLPASMTITGDPGQVVWLWAGPTVFSPPGGFEGFEYDYVSTFSGLGEGVVATDRTTFGSIKSLYR